MATCPKTSCLSINFFLTGVFYTSSVLTSLLVHSLSQLLQVLLEPYKYVIQNPGKEIRTLLINAFNLWLDIPQEKVRWTLGCRDLQ